MVGDMMPMKIAGMCQRGWEYGAWIALCLALGVETYAELGWGCGATAEYANNAGLYVASVDFNPVPQGGPREHIKYIHGNSWDKDSVSQVIELFHGYPDAVFIDAEHTQGCPQKDFEAWWPVTKQVLAFHDIEAFDSGVLWKEVSKKYRSLEIRSLDRVSQLEWEIQGAQFAGIGILFKE